MLRSLYLTALLFAILPLIVLSPHAGVLVWSWFSYMNPHTLTGGFAATTGYLDFVTAFTIIAWIFSKERKSLPPHVLLVPFFLWVIWTCITALGAVSFDISWTKMEKFLKMILFTVITMFLITTRHRINALLYVIILALGFFALKGGFSVIVGGGAGRISGPPGTMLTDNNHLALGLAMMFPICRYVQLHGEHKLVRLAGLGFMILCALAVLATFSRGGLITLGVVLIFFIVKSRRRMIAIGMGAVAAVAAIFLMPSNWQERMETISDFQEDQSAVGRLQMWRYAMILAEDHPFSGGGFRVFHKKDLAASYLPEHVPLRASHSIYFEVLGEHGYIGLGLFLWLFICAYLSMSQLQRKVKDIEDLAWARDLASMLQISLTAFMVGGALLEVAILDLYYTFIAVAISVDVIVRRELAKRSEGERGKDLIGLPQVPQPAGVLARGER
jgi:probable O-glycosylation ligase (exosortase A-associated)